MINDFYIPANTKLWSGRVDGIEPDKMRLHQVITPINLEEEVFLNGAIVFLGFAVMKV